MRSMAQKFLYLVDFWVPFPASEYSGLLVVVGEDDNEVYDILLNWRDDYHKKYDSLIMQDVIKAQRFSLMDEQQSRIVEVFVT